MAAIPNFIFYIFVFLSVYVQVFLLVTFFENRRKIVTRKGETKLSRYPTVTIIVPCWNEETTVYKTIRSLLNLNYPKDKFQLFLVDDGSTDGTWNAIQKFAHYSNVQVFKKENGGKHTVLNLGLEKSNSEFFACLDADSFVHPESLARIMTYFERDPEVMAVAPSVTVHEPKNFLQGVQSMEYFMGVYMKKMLGFLGAINVTPGPLTVFRKKVFDDLGPYRHAHNTEDMEIAYRMQKHHYKIEHCNDAYVYTSTPTTVKKLYKQRLRWIYGFINNTLDYRSLILKKKYGNFSLFTLPTGIVSIVAASILFGKIVYNMGDFLYTKFVHFQIVGFEFGGVGSFDPFFIKAQTTYFLIILVYSTVLFAMVFGRYLSDGKWRFNPQMLLYFPVFSIIAPFWIMKAVWNTVTSRAPSWR